MDHLMIESRSRRIGFVSFLSAIAAGVICIGGDLAVLKRSWVALTPSYWVVNSPSMAQHPTAFVYGTSGQRFKMQRTRIYAGHLTSQKRGLLPLDAGEDESKSRRCETWVVVTTINPPTKTLQQLAALPDLCVCVVGDKKTPSDFQLPGIIYLSPDKQEDLPYGIAALIPWNHFGRKNIGYLYAIHRGAQVIYDADDDNELIDNLTEIPYLHGVDGRSMKYVDVNPDSEQLAVNLYPAFGASLSWPRGFPLDQIRQSVAEPLTTREVASGSKVTIGVIQSLANHDPDVDAIYRLSTLPLPFDFHAEDPGMVGLLPHTQVMPFNAQATLHYHHAFWGMLLPTTVHGRVSDIWRSYFSQRLLWETGGMVAFASPWVVQHRNAHNYLSDFQAEGHLYERATALVDYLFREWQCYSEEADLAQCTVQLYKDMYEHGIVEAADVELVVEWTADLRNVGYVFPKRVKQSAPDYTPRIHLVDEYLAEPSADGREIKITAAQATSFPHAAPKTEAWADFYEDADWSRRSDVPPRPVVMMGDSSFRFNFQNVSLGSARYISVRYTDRRGGPVVVRLKKALVPVPVFEDVLLVVNFNFGKDYPRVKEYLDICGQAFPNHIATGTDSLKDPAVVDPVEFIISRELGHGAGMPLALKYAMERYPDYRGYLLVNNDVAMRFWKWAHFDRDRIWMSPRMGPGPEYDGPKVDDYSDPLWNDGGWPSEKEAGYLRKFLSSLSEAQQRQVLTQPNGEQRFPLCGSDFFYVPGLYKDRFVHYVDILNDVWIQKRLFEAATPMLLAALAPYSEWQPMNGTYCWSPDRNDYCPTVFIKNKEVDYVHPWKLGLSKGEHPFLTLRQQGQVVFLKV